MPARKRGRQEAELDSSLVAVEKAQPYNETLDKLRNMWQFAALMQYIYLFGRVVKIDGDFDMDDLEHECLSPEGPEKLAELGLALLKYVSSHRGLTLHIFDEYTRRQYLAKAPQRNPFGEDEEPRKFIDFDVFTKIRVLQQLSTWTLGNAERIRSGMGDEGNDQTQWRIEELGWDAQDRSYYVLDDDRLYRRTDAPLPPEPKAKPKAKPKARKSRGSRTSKRRKLSTPLDDENGDEGQETDGAEKEQEPTEDDGFGRMKWECIAVTHDDYQTFLESIRRSKDVNEKALHKRIVEQVMPIIGKRVEAQRQRLLKKQRELENVQKMANAKRSTRIAGRMEARKAEEDAAEAEKKRLADLDMARKEQQRQTKMEHARESRMLTREQRMKEREVNRILHEEQLRKLEENQKNLELGIADDATGRISERQLKTEMERRQKELDKLAEEEDDWVFDCAVCGMHGQNLDDGTHSIACEKCNIWQHSKCHGIDEKDADKDDFHFICNGCKNKDRPKLAPLHLHFPGQNESPRGRPLDAVQITTTSTPRSSAHRTHLLDGPSLSPSGQSPGPPGYHPQGHTPVGVPQPAWKGATLPPPPRPSSNYGSSSPPPFANVADVSASPAPLQLLHQQAHAGAMSSHTLPPTQANGLAPHMGPPSPTKAASRPSSSHGLSERRPSLNGLGTPHQPNHPRPSASPSSQANLFQSPNTSFPPPALPSTYQRAAASSPTKQASSPSHAQSFYTPGSNTYAYAPPNATPNAAVNILGPSPGLQSSPIPPLPAGNPVIPTKHDTPRPRSRDSMAETPVIPPITALSPSPALMKPGPQREGEGEGVKGVETALGVGSVPVKKMPPHGDSEGDDVGTRDV